MAQGENVNQWTQTKPLGALGDRRQKHARRRRHAERRRMMFGDMIGVEAAVVVDLGELEPALIEFRQARGATVDVIEDSEFHGFWSLLKRRRAARLTLFWRAD